MLELREICRGDLAEINSWRSSRGLVDCLGAPFRFINQEVDEAWFDAYLRSRANTIRCAVVEEEAPDAILGIVALTGIDWVLRSAVLHLMGGRKANQGRGVGTFATHAMLQHAFDDMNLHRVELEVLTENDRALSVYQRAGFSVEGTKRQAAYKHGKYVDVHMMSILKDDWVSRPSQ